MPQTTSIMVRFNSFIEITNRKSKLLEYTKASIANCSEKSTKAVKNFPPCSEKNNRKWEKFRVTDINFPKIRN